MRDPCLRSLRALAIVALVLGASGAALVPVASAQVTDDESPFRQGGDDERPSSGAPSSRSEASSPIRLLGGLGYTFSLRVVKHGSVTPETLAPASLQLDLGFVFPGSGVYRHAVALSTSTNVVNFDNEGVDALSQWTTAPSYLAYIRLSRDLLITGRFGVPLSITTPNIQNTDAYFNWGLELAGGVAYYLTAGFGLWGQVGASMIFGAADKVYLLTNATVGVIFDWEVLS